MFIVFISVLEYQGDTVESQVRAILNYFKIAIYELLMDDSLVELKVVVGVNSVPV